VKATGLETLRVPTKLASGGAGLSVRKVGAGGDSGVVGNKSGAKNRSFFRHERHGHGDRVEKDAEVFYALAVGIFGVAERNSAG
jgi:hypothetical protein